MDLNFFQTRFYFFKKNRGFWRAKIAEGVSNYKMQFMTRPGKDLLLKITLPPPVI